MIDMTPQEHEERFEIQSNAANHFAWARTRLAVERTMMASVRTAVALIGFGFTIVQFFEHLGHLGGVAPAARPMAPRYVGLVLIAAGVITLLVSAWQYRMVLRYLWEHFRPLAGMGGGPLRTPIYAITLGMILIGVFAFLVVLTRAI